MIGDGLLAAVAVPALGWILYVERRLGRIETLDAKLDLLIEYLVPPDKAKSVRNSDR